MNITVHTPTDADRVAERRRCTHVGVERVTIELDDGVQFDLTQHAPRSVVIATPGSALLVEAIPPDPAHPDDVLAVILSTHLTDEQYAVLVLQLSALGQRTDLVLEREQRATLVHLLEQAIDNVRQARIPRWLAPDGTYRSDEEEQ